jgi:hypothetical protein
VVKGGANAPSGYFLETFFLPTFFFGFGFGFGFGSAM